MWSHNLTECKVLCVIAWSVSSLFPGHTMDDLHVDGVGPSRRSCVQKKQIKKTVCSLVWGSVCSLTLFPLGVSAFIEFARGAVRKSVCSLVWGQCVH